MRLQLKQTVVNRKFLIKHAKLNFLHKYIFKLDYLEPIMTNVIQNFEYFSDTNQKQLVPQQPAPLPPPRIIVTDNSESKNINRNYYNEGMSAVLDKKRQTLI